MGGGKGGNGKGEREGRTGIAGPIQNPLLRVCHNMHQETYRIIMLVGYTVPCQEVCCGVTSKGVKSGR